MPSSAEQIEDHDIVIIGAGVSGINTAHILRKQLPHRNFIILEAREALGGTWRLFRYPGIRSDSSMTTFAFKWHPWPHAHRLGSAADIVNYLEDAAKTDGTLEQIRFKHRVTGLEWRSSEQRWTLDVEADGVAKKFHANIILGCSGYYSYEKGLEAVIPGIDSFGGRIVHPQFWPEDLDYSGKRIIIIGSGATTITLVPQLAKTAGHLTMLQRSPSYLLTLPTRTPIDTGLRALLPLSWAYQLLWWLDMALTLLVVHIMTNYPRFGRFIVRSHVKQMVPKDVDVDVHFNPRYNPFQQRLCFSADGDFFQALHQDNCEIVTDVIETVKEDGVLLKSGRFLPADMLVTATGLHFQLLDGLTPVVDGKPIHAGSHYAWRGCMLDSLPNLILIIGYVDSTWTPGADIMARMAVKIMKHMEKKGATSVAPKVVVPEGAESKPVLPATSTYFVAAADRMPKSTGESPWYGRNGLFTDLRAVLWGDMEDGLVYERREAKKTA